MDSTIVLHSLRTNCKRFPIFLRNRLRRILKYSTIFDWNYVGLPSKLNPANKASSGLTAHDLLRNDVWFSRLRFLKDEPSKWPETIPVASCDGGDIFRPYDSERNVYKCKVANQDTGFEAVIVANMKQTKSAVVVIQPTSKLILHFSINQSIFWTRLSLGGRGGSSSSWILQASRSSATKDRCSAGMPRRDQLRSST